jgi:hypothetical protein
MEEEIQVPASFDDFVQGIPEETSEVKTSQNSMETRFAKERKEWTEKINDLSLKIKRLVDMIELETTVYTERQRLVEYYHFLLSLIHKVNKSYTKKYAEKYDYYSYHSQKRFPNEAKKDIQIMAELGDDLFKKQILENHSKFILGTIDSIDKLIYGIKNRVDIENIMNGK